NVRWCVSSPEEFRKCEKLSQSIKTISQLSVLYSVTCIQGAGEFHCMRLIHNREADLLNLDAGLAHYGSTFYSLRPIAVENYADSNEPTTRELFYYANVVVPINTNPTPINLRGKEICSAGAGTAEGWVMPFGKLIADLRAIPVTQCNSVVQNLIRYLGDSCIPNTLSAEFNPFGDNTEELCSICANQGLQSWCTTQDRYAGNQGALRCLREYNENIESTIKPTAALVRAKEIELAAADGFPATNYKLLCPTQQAGGQWTAGLEAATNSCQWGQIPSRMIMTSLTMPNVTVFNQFLTSMVQYFGPTGTHVQTFSLFQSTGYGTSNVTDPTHNLMFSDFTRNIYVPPEEETATYYRWISADFMQAVRKLEECPLPTMGWCLIDQFEFVKCERMSSAFAARRIKPDLTCIQAESAIDCMRLIQDGYADMITLEAGDLYSAGKYFDLVPIVADRACIPGILNQPFDMKEINPLSLCERCTGGNRDLCRRDHRELYYGDSGAFRCLTESGDIAFARHTTVHTNTAGRNPDYWARNLREDDYELLCSDGRREDVDKWSTCNLARISSNVVVTASYKSENERTNMWRMLQYGQDYYSADK
ncbi:hypothetical protein AHF37_07694, partial [Paragonimus kellicotti]